MKRLWQVGLFMGIRCHMAHINLVTGEIELGVAKPEVPSLSCAKAAGNVGRETQVARGRKIEASRGEGT